MNDTYKGDGITLRKYPDGTEKRIPWQSISFETRDKLYCVRRHDTGEVTYSVNCEFVDALPKTPGTLKILAACPAEWGYIDISDL